MAVRWIALVAISIAAIGCGAKEEAADTSKVTTADKVSRPMGGTDAPGGGAAQRAGVSAPN